MPSLAARLLALPVAFTANLSPLSAVAQIVAATEGYKRPGRPDAWAATASAARGGLCAVALPAQQPR